MKHVEEMRTCRQFNPYCPVKLASLHKLVKLAALHAVG
jgi:hypothetical protein